MTENKVCALLDSESLFLQNAPVAASSRAPQLHQLSVITNRVAR